IIAVGPAKFVDVGPIPAFVAVINRCRAERKRLHLGVEVRVEEERKRQPVAPAHVPHSMRRRTVQPASQPIQHIADVANKRSGDGMSLYPACLRFDLQSSRFILLQNRQQPIIGVLPNAPSGGGGPCSWSGVVEYAKQYQRVARVVFGEIRFVKAEAERYAAHQRVAYT